MENKTMRKIYLLALALLTLFFITACADEQTVEQEDLAILDVEFEPQETANVGETVELVATVTYGDELVTDAREMDFEYWLEDDEDNSEMVEATNNNDGTYSIEVEFEEEGEYWIYAHTTAHDLHTMPKRSIQVSK